MLLQKQDVDGAAREYARAEMHFPVIHSLRRDVAKVAVARGQVDEALTIYRALLTKTPTSETAIAIGDLSTQNGDAAGAQAMYARAEAIERDAWLTEARLTTNVARMLAERGVRTSEPFSWRKKRRAIGKTSSRWTRCAWAYYRAGRLVDARRITASAQDGNRRSPYSRARCCYR
jgi:tetratricopeptide (TPR) repeat protein